MYLTAIGFCNNAIFFKKGGNNFIKYLCILCIILITDILRGNEIKYHSLMLFVRNKSNLPVSDNYTFALHTLTILAYRKNSSFLQLIFVMSFNITFRSNILLESIILTTIKYNIQSQLMYSITYRIIYPY